MRILQVAHLYLPRHRTGVEIYTDRLARALLAHGHEVTVFTTEDSPTERDLSVRHRVVAGVPVIEVVNNKLYSSLRDTFSHAGMERRFAEALDAARPEVVHFQHLLFHSLGDVRIAADRCVPTVLTLHEYWLQCLRGGLRRTADGTVCHDVPEERCARCLVTNSLWPSRGEKRAIRIARAVRAASGIDVRPLLRAIRVRAPRLARAATGGGAPGAAREPDAAALASVRERNAVAAAALASVGAVLAPSRFLLEEFVARSGVPREKLLHWTFGLDPKELGLAAAEPRPARRPGDPLRLTYIGNPAPHKGLDTAIRAMALLPAGVATLAVHGSAARHPEYLASALAAAPRGAVLFRGEFGHGEAAAVLAATDALVFPSLWFENSPLTIHEAQLRAVPVLASRLGAIPEFVRDGENGLLFEPGDAAALAAAVRRLAFEPGLLERLRAGSRPAVRSVDEEVAELVSLYDALRRRGRR